VKIDDSKNNDINMVIIGHVDAGKSTLMGHLLHLLGYVGHQEIRKNEKMSVEYGKASFHFAWIMD
jgi:elongation factor 1 alpha-like protein